MDTSQYSSVLPSNPKPETAEQNVQLQECKRKQEFYLLIRRRQILISVVSTCLKLRNLVLFLRLKFSHLNSSIFGWGFGVSYWKMRTDRSGSLLGCLMHDHSICIKQIFIWPSLCAKHCARWWNAVANKLLSALAFSELKGGSANTCQGRYEGHYSTVWEGL